MYSKSTIIMSTEAMTEETTSSLRKARHESLAQSLKIAHDFIVSFSSDTRRTTRIA